MISPKIIVLLFLLCLQLANGQRNPTISFISKNKVVNIGDTLELLCQVQDAASYPVAWTKLGREQTFISKGQSVVIPGDRHHIFYSEGDSTYKLIIEKIQEIDAGIYRCEITTSVNTNYSADVPVLVRIPPVISDNSTRSVITTVGAKVALQCYGAGYPQPIISWRREKHRLLPNNMAFFKGNTLSIDNVTKDDRGTYYCIADNGVGGGARRHIGVEVEFQPHVWSSQPKVEQALQYDADLHCRIESFPLPAVNWIKDGQVLNDNQNYRISIFARNDDFMETTLRVRRIEKRQFGTYECRALNKLGYNYTTIELIESVNIVCPPACGVGFQASYASKSSSVSVALLLCTTFGLILLRW
ncbi:hypothetical protein RDWZM_005338 [Blomia tropicalis]|uniref:Ig-like domain-containing protein n=1 Tax=Blomia tropicalis TaxID=40697 RepID=A0A9Q0M562_BLOTA|nr:hypothetical protein RDWZM_005338 [Blomia tropicalis]